MYSKNGHQNRPSGGRRGGSDHCATTPGIYEASVAGQGKCNTENGGGKKTQPVNLQVNGDNVASAILQYFGRRVVEVMRDIAPSLSQPSLSQSSKLPLPISDIRVLESISSIFDLLSNIVNQFGNITSFKMLVDKPITSSMNIHVDYMNIASPNFPSLAIQNLPALMLVSIQYAPETMSVH